jgi:hypothetical protein
MTIQATYHNTGLTPQDVIDAGAHGKLKMFDVKPRDDGVHVMLHPDQYEDVNIQISSDAANVWASSFDQLNEIEDLLNETFGDSFNTKPFKERDMVFNPGELRKLQETPLGVINAFAYYYPSVIADAVYKVIQCMNNWDKHP